MAHSIASMSLQTAWTPPDTDTTAAPNGTGADLFIYTNFNNWPGRFFMPGLGDNTSEVLFDWHEFGRLRGSSLVWTEDWFGDGSAFQWSYLASIMRLAAEGSSVHRPRRAGELSIGGDIVPRDATGWPPGSGAARHVDGGLFRKIMTFVGSGAKAVKFFQFGPEYLFPVRVLALALALVHFGLSYSQLMGFNHRVRRATATAIANTSPTSLARCTTRTG